MNLFVKIVLRVAGCTLVTALVWRSMGLAVAVATIPLWAVALARPILDTVEVLYGGIRTVALRDVEGQYFAYAGHPIEVIETSDARWLRAAQVQRVLDDRAPESAFVRRFGSAERMASSRGRWYLRDEALVDYLDRSMQAMDGRRNGLRLFVMREVIDPHRRARRRARD